MPESKLSDSARIQAREMVANLWHELQPSTPFVLLDRETIERLLAIAFQGGMSLERAITLATAAGNSTCPSRLPTRHQG